LLLDDSSEFRDGSVNTSCEVDATAAAAAEDASVGETSAESEGNII